MLDEEMDNIIRDAAEKHHPPYNDKAWEMMEKKLDKHLPQNKDRRKFIFFLLFFLLLGGATVFTIMQFSGGKTPGNTEIIAGNITENKTAAPVTKTNEPGNNDVINNSNPQNTTNSIQSSANTNTVTGTPVPGSTTNDVTIPGNKTNPSATPGLSKSVTTKPVITSTASSQNAVVAQTNTTAQKEFALNGKEKPVNDKKSNFKSKGKTNTNIVAALPAEDLAKHDPEKAKINKGVKKNIKGKLKVSVSTPGQEIDQNVSAKAVPSENKHEAEEKKEMVVTIEEVNNKKEKDPVVTKDKSSSIPDKKKPKKNIAGNFGLTFSAGPDMSFVSLNNPGKTTMTYGAGISYAFSKRFTVRTGFYVTKKKYSATPGQYHNVIYPNLTGVGADCKVYEIPLSLSYNFAQRKNHNWFGNIGLSSFIMKTEDYDYRYKTPTGITYNYKHTVKNENEHYFAVLSLSGGYQYQFNNRISLQGEPYINLPLSGIGYGKIKLSSTGVLFTLTVKPFAKGK